MSPWDRATLALNLLAIDPQRLGGLVIRARSGPARDALLAAAARLPFPRVRLHPQMTGDALDGGLDVSATLGSGTVVMQRGLLHREPSMLILPMAERASPYLAARLGQTLDADAGHVLLALDEGAEDDEVLSTAIADRIAFHVTLDGLTLADLTPADPPATLTAMRRAVRKIDIPDDIPEQLVVLAVRLGITSLRAPGLALRAAQAHAALKGRDTLAEDDIAAAVGLVFAHRATQLPDSDAPDDPNPNPTEPDDAPTGENLSIPDEVLLEAVKTALPADLLDGFASRVTKARGGGGSGAKRTGSRRGRPLPARNGPRTGNARVDLIATLRAAVPWQTLRKQRDPDSVGPIVHPTDLRYKRYQSLSDRLIVFAVDASGSAAMARLAEAKGAVELLLAEAYVRRDHVALIAFRGTQADVLLPPTRSLVQTKRRLAALPGGGATPLASGLSAAMQTARTAMRKGMSPMIVLLTDGRANVALDGEPDRNRAAQDAQDIARQIAAARIDALVVDTTVRPNGDLRRLALAMHAEYVALPRVDAQTLSAAVSRTLAD